MGWDHVAGAGKLIGGGEEELLRAGAQLPTFKRGRSDDGRPVLRSARHKQPQRHPLTKSSDGWEETARGRFPVQPGRLSRLKRKDGSQARVHAARAQSPTHAHPLYALPRNNQ